MIYRLKAHPPKKWQKLQLHTIGVAAKISSYPPIKFSVWDHHLQEEQITLNLLSSTRYLYHWLNKSGNNIRFNASINLNRLKF